MKYLVNGVAKVNVFIEVEAENEEEALEKAYTDFSGLVAYAGNGGSNRLIGVPGEKESISADDPEIEWDEAEEI